MKMTGYETYPNTQDGSAEPPSRRVQDRFALRFEVSRPRLEKLCSAILSGSDAARDAVNETYLRAFRRYAEFDGLNFEGWLRKIAKNICLDSLRTTRPMIRLEDVVGPVTTESEVKIVTALQIQAIFAKLPKGQRECLKLFYLEGYTAEEVAKETRLSLSQVRSHLQNGRRNFIRAWKALEDKSHA